MIIGNPETGEITGYEWPGSGDNTLDLDKIIRAIINEELDKRFPKPTKQELPNIKEITANSAYQGPYTKPKVKND